MDVPSLEVLKPRLDGDPEQPGSRGVPACGRDVITGSSFRSLQTQAILWFCASKCCFLALF